MQQLPPEVRRDVILSLKAPKSMRPLSPIEVAEAFDVALRNGASFRDIAAVVGFDSDSTLREIHRLLNLPRELRHLVGWGRGSSRSPLSMTAASQIARLNTTTDQQAVAEAVLAHSLTSEEARQVVETRLRSGRSIAESIDTVLRLRPQIERKDLLLGAVTSEMVCSRLQRMTQRERDELLRQAVTDCFGQLPEWTGSLSPARFSLLGDQTFGEKLRALPNGFEAAVNSCLEAKICDQ